MNNTQRTRIVIIGAGYAGLMTALRLAGKDRQQQAKITLVNASDHFVERIRNHQAAADQPIKRYAIRQLLGKRPVDFVQGWVTALDLDTRTVQVDVQGKTREIGYDYLVYALGSIAAKPNIPGLSQHAYAIANVDEAVALRDRLARTAPGDRVAVVGGGYTGIETATEIAETYPQLQVSLVTSGEPGAGLSTKGRNYLGTVLQEMGIRVYDHSRVESVGAESLVTGDGRRILADVTVWAGSFVAAPLARESGLAVNTKGQILVDAFMRALSHPEIFVAGDAADPMEDPGAPLRMACAVALPMGAYVADNLLALVNEEPEQPFNFNYSVQCVSLGRNRGLLQFVNGDDSPQEKVWTGRMGAIAKELICQYAFRSLQAERILPGAQTWVGKGHIPATFDKHIRQHA